MEAEAPRRKYLLRRGPAGIGVAAIGALEDDAAEEDDVEVDAFGGGAAGCAVSTGGVVDGPEVCGRGGGGALPGYMMCAGTALTGSLEGSAAGDPVLALAGATPPGVSGKVAPAGELRQGLPSP